LSQLFTKCSQALDLLPSERRIVTHDIKRASLRTMFPRYFDWTWHFCHRTL